MKCTSIEYRQRLTVSILTVSVTLNLGSLISSKEKKTSDDGKLTTSYVEEEEFITQIAGRNRTTTLERRMIEKEERINPQIFCPSAQERKLKDRLTVYYLQNLMDAPYIGNAEDR